MDNEQLTIGMFYKLKKQRAAFPLPSRGGERRTDLHYLLTIVDRLVDYSQQVAENGQTQGGKLWSIMSIMTIRF